MALGNTYDNNKQQYSPQVISGYRFSNPESKVDASCVTFKMWKGFLVVSINPRKPGTGSDVSYDYDNAGTVYLTHTKAQILAKEIKHYMESGFEGKNVGVASGKDGLISLSSGKEYGSDSPCLTIRKINPDDGLPSAEYIYQFRNDIHSSVINYDIETAKFDNRVYPNIELEQFISLLEDFARVSHNAFAYSVIDCAKYDYSRINTKITKVAEKLGVEFKSSNSYNKGSNNSYFSRNNNTQSNYDTDLKTSESYEAATLDDIM